MTPVDALQERLGHPFGRPDLLLEALTHPSWLQDHPETPRSNQRLEFLGDAVLQLHLTDALFRRFPDEREGGLSKRRAALSKGRFLSALARECGVDAALRLGQSEEQTGGRQRDAALEDAFEAVIGAVFEDAGIEAARACLARIYGDLDARLAPVERVENPKGRLQERVQPDHGNQALRYEVVHVDGLDHARTYEAVVRLLGVPLGRGRGSSKKVAEEAAAREALASLDREAQKKG
jgi:ribonuclease III